MDARLGAEPPVGDSWTAAALESPPDAGARPGGVWRRGVALAVDLFVVWTLLRAGDLVAGRLTRWDLLARAFGIAWVLVVPVAYVALSQGTAGRTLGKWLLGIRVVGEDGRPIGYGRALGRAVAWGVSAGLLGLGFLVAAVREDRRALHDLVAGTRVVRGR